MFEIINIVKKNNSDFAYKTIEIKNWTTHIEGWGFLAHFC
jgi:hypothetical protein